MVVRLVVCVAFVLCGASIAAAQSDTTRWGASVSLAPKWTVPTGSGPLAQLGELMFESGDFGMNVRGSDFRIGAVRGRSLAGEWGVSFVRRTMKDGSTQGGIEEQCFDNPGPGGQTIRQCFSNGTFYIYHDVTMRGVEVNKFIPFVLIKKRIQVGVDLAGGFGVLKGSAERRDPETIYTDVRNAQGQIIGQTTTTIINSTIVDAKTLMGVDPTLIGRVELAVAGILMPRLKVRFSGGINFPGMHSASLTASYFFGR